MSVVEVLFKKHTAYKAALSGVMLLSAVAAVRAALPVFMWIFAAWGLVIIALDLTDGKKLWKDGSVLLLMAFCFFYLISVLVNGYAIGDGLRTVLYMAVTFAVLCGGAKHSDEERAKERRILITEYFIILFVFGIASLVTYIAGLELVYEVGGITGYAGSYCGRLTGLFDNTTCGRIFAVAVLLDLGLLLGYECGKKYEKVLIIVGLVLSAVLLYLSYSRTSIYALSFALAIGTFWLLPRAMKSLSANSKRTVLLSKCVAGLLVLLILIAIMDPARALFSNIGGIFSSKDAEVSRTAEPELQETAAVSEDNIDEMIEQEKASLNGVLDGRGEIWNAALDVFSENTMLGITHEAIPEHLGSLVTNEKWAGRLKAGSVYNGYLDVLLSSGLTGAVFLGLYLTVSVFRLIKRRSMWTETKDASFIVMLLLVLMLLSAELMESTVMYGAGFCGTVLWISVGLLREELYVAPVKRIRSLVDKDENEAEI